MATNMADDNVSEDELYSPSRWSTRLSADVIVDRHIEILYEGRKSSTDIAPYLQSLAH